MALNSVLNKKKDINLSNYLYISNNCLINLNKSVHLEMFQKSCDTHNNNIDYTVIHATFRHQQYLRTHRQTYNFLYFILFIMWKLFHFTEPIIILIKKTFGSVKKKFPLCYEQVLYISK